MESVLASAKPPERLQRQFEPIPIPERYVYVSSDEMGGRRTFEVAQAWTVFAQAIREGGRCAPDFGDVLKIHYGLDAAEESARTRAWARVDYSGL